VVTKPYFVKNSRWTGWNPYSKDHPYLQNKEKLTQKHLCDYGDFSLWVWDYVGKSSMVVAYHPSEVEVGYVGYYPEGTKVWLGYYCSEEEAEKTFFEIHS
jgi:hypothetical protein